MNDAVWIEIDDRLPMHATSVLVKVRNGDVLSGKYVNNPDDPKQGFVVSAQLAYDDITHWRYEA